MPVVALDVGARESGPAQRKTADALSVEGWRRGIVHEGPGV
jgi:hypothetical protein